MFKTLKADRYFIISATIIWIAGLAVTIWDFIYLQGATFRFSIVSSTGLILAIAGVTIRLISRRTLGRYFSSGLRIVEKHELVTYGIYRYVRHPAYTGDLLFQFGLTLFFSSLYGLLIMLLLVPCILYRIGIEEDMLIKQFGTEYLEYMRTSKKLIPYIY